MPQVQVTRRHLLGPRQNLERWVKQEASLAQVVHGFTYRPAEDAASTHPALAAAYRISAKTGKPYPVSFTNCDNTIFTMAECNWAIRFVHDLEHAKRELSFSIEDELVLGMQHLEARQLSGYGVESQSTSCCTPTR